VTLLELLVVMLILLMVTAAAIPIVVPAMQNRQMRESARLVSSYFSVARSRAIEIGRPVGVMVERFNGQPFGMVLSQVEVPPPYSGDVVDSQITVDGTTGEITAFVSGDTAWTGLVRYGDLVKLNYKGPPYILASVQGTMTPTVDARVGEAITDTPGTNWFLQTTVLTQPLLPPGLATTGVPYQIIRQPTRSSTAPLQLPEGIVVDLVCSGMGAAGTFNQANYSGMTGSTPPAPIVLFDPVILFSTSGRVEAVSQGAIGILGHPNDAIYLLLGRRELMYDVVAKNQPQDIVDQNLSPVPATAGVPPTPPPHFWVSVGYQTGLVTVAEVAANCQDYAPMAPMTLASVVQTALGQARQFARQSQSVGGR
jgi:type II secretory pathway pseudopilin PulG